MVGEVQHQEFQGAAATGGHVLDDPAQAGHAVVVQTGRQLGDQQGVEGGQRMLDEGFDGGPGGERRGGECRPQAQVVLYAVKTRKTVHTPAPL